MTDQTDTKRDDGRPWGYIDNGVWWQLPKPPMLNAELGPPPFTIVMSNGRVRHVVHKPADAELGGRKHKPWAIGTFDTADGGMGIFIRRRHWGKAGRVVGSWPRTAEAAEIAGQLRQLADALEQREHDDETATLEDVLSEELGEPVPADQAAAFDAVIREDHETLKAMPAD